MATYVYETIPQSADEQPERFEVQQSMKDDALTAHPQTGKPIKPLAPSANPQRLTDLREINKWLLRNCKWTLGRECSAQEKGDFLTWLRQQ